VKVTAQNVCGAFADSLLLQVALPPVIDSQIADTTFCPGNVYQVSVNQNNAEAIVWMDSTNTWQHDFDSTGTYFYHLSNFCGTTSDSFMLTIEQPANAFLGNDTLICYGEQIVKEFHYPNHQFEWTNGSTDSLLIITEPGMYGVTIYTPHNCVSSDELEVVSCNTQLFIPNAFSPNNDGHNEIFLATGVGIKAFRMVVYNRWGQEVFQTNDITQGWNGVIRQQPAAADVYTYKVWYNTGHSSQSVTKTGTVTLVR
jgi:gliding motility-associated-like protein